MLHFTLASFPVVGQVKAIWAETERTAGCVQTNVRASTVVRETLVDILAGVIIRGQFVTGNIGAATLVASFQIDASALAWTVRVIHQALVNV